MGDSFVSRYDETGTELTATICCSLQPHHGTALLKSDSDSLPSMQIAAMAAPNPSSPALPQERTRRHRKRASALRLSSDTTGSLPPYRPSLAFVEPFEQPPDYPDSAEEADEETDDQVSQLLSPPLSPRSRRRKLYRSVSQTRTGGSFYETPSTQSDIFLDKILERSVAALELSNALLQSSMSAESSLNTALPSAPPSPPPQVDYQTRQLTERIRGNHATQERWMDDLDMLSQDVEALCDDDPGPSVGRMYIPGRLRVSNNEADAAVSRSLPSTGLPKRQHRSAIDLHRRGSDSGRLRLTSEQRFTSAPPRAMTQYINAGADLEDVAKSSSEILLPSTTGLRSCSHLSSFSFPVSSHFSPPPPSPSAYECLARQASRSPESSRSPSISGSSNRTYRQRSRSRSSNRLPSPHMLPRILPPPIQELPSQSDSSSSDSPHPLPLRTLESLRKILDEQPMPPSPSDLKGKQPESTRSPPSFLPRTPPVGPVSSTSTTTTSISRLFTKGSHSTSTRPRSPPRHSSLKRRPPPLQTDPGASSSSISDLLSPVPTVPSATSSGRSTPRSVAFGPLPGPIRPEGVPSRFKEQRDAKAKAKARSRSSRRDSGNREKEKEGESSWWTTWLTGGSGLSMSAARSEERAEDRMARSWGRPAMGAGFDDWPV